VSAFPNLVPTLSSTQAATHGVSCRSLFGRRAFFAGPFVRARTLANLARGSSSNLALLTAPVGTKVLLGLARGVTVPVILGPKIKQ
jgi:hypothetical protein